MTETNLSKPKNQHSIRSPILAVANPNATDPKENVMAIPFIQNGGSLGFADYPGPGDKFISPDDPDPATTLIVPQAGTGGSTQGVLNGNKTSAKMNQVITQGAEDAKNDNKIGKSEYVNDKKIGGRRRTRRKRRKKRRRRRRTRRKHRRRRQRGGKRRTRRRSRRKKRGRKRRTRRKRGMRGGAQCPDQCSCAGMQHNFNPCNLAVAFPAISSEGAAEAAAAVAEWRARGFGAGEAATPLTCTHELGATRTTGGGFWCKTCYATGPSVQRGVRLRQQAYD